MASGLYWPPFGEALMFLRAPALTACIKNHKAGVCVGCTSVASATRETGTGEWLEVRGLG